MKIKSSVILEHALKLIISGEQTYACCAIQDVETTMRWVSNENIVSKAQMVFNSFRPKHVADGVMLSQQWWPKGDVLRIEALEKAIALAYKRND